MILGIGTDLANIDRIQAVLDRHGDRFRNRVFTEREQAKARGGHLCQTLGRERGLFQGFGDRFAHGDIVERYGCEQSEIGPARDDSDGLGKNPLG